LGVCCTNPCEQLSGEISTHLVPQLGLGDERLLHTILFSTRLHLSLQKIAGRTVIVIPARAHHSAEEFRSTGFESGFGDLDTWVVLTIARSISWHISWGDWTPLAAGPNC
jgi:hypothetical protein